MGHLQIYQLILDSLVLVTKKSITAKFIIKDRSNLLLVATKMMKKNRNKVITTKKLNQNSKDYEKIHLGFQIAKKEKYSRQQDLKKRKKDKKMKVNLMKI